jgi:hypothetical protein
MTATAFSIRTEVFKNWFKPLTAEDCEQLPQQQLEMHLTMVIAHTLTP